MIDFSPALVYVNGVLPCLVCLLCEKAVVEGEYITMPWGSNYDGDVVCVPCVCQHFDPVIARVISEKVKNEENC